MKNNWENGRLTNVFVDKHDIYLNKIIKFIKLISDTVLGLMQIWFILDIN